MIGGRALKIGGSAIHLGWIAAGERLRRVPPENSQLPAALRRALERLGPAFVKLGQALSLREDILPTRYVDELGGLNDSVAAFAPELARREIEVALGTSIESVFATFESLPLAAASIAQVHVATLRDGRPVVVKVRRPGIKRIIDRDMRALTRVLRMLAWLSPTLARYEPARIAAEIWRNLQRETDFRLEARAMQRFAQGVSPLGFIEVPAIIDELARASVLVQERKSGRLLGDKLVQDDGPLIASRLVKSYVFQFFVLGFFHGDPHPGNLFFGTDGRICFHDFGIFGELDEETRQNLAMFVQGFVNRDAAWMLDYAVALGLLAEPGTGRRQMLTELRFIVEDYAAMPMKDWSMGELFRRVSRAGSSGSARVPWDMLVLIRAATILESMLRRLDPTMNVLEALAEQGKDVISQLTVRDHKTALKRLRYEVGLAADELPRVVGTAVRQLRGGGFRAQVPISIAELDEATARLERMGNRLSVAVVSLGLFIGSSLLMQHSIGPRLLGVPVLSLIGYIVALWLALRLTRAVARSGHL